MMREIFYSSAFIRGSSPSGHLEDGVARAEVARGIEGADHQDVEARLEVGQVDLDRLVARVEEAVDGEDVDPIAAVEGVRGLDQPRQVVLEPDGRPPVPGLD